MTDNSNLILLLVLKVLNLLIIIGFCYNGLDKYEMHIFIRLVDATTSLTTFRISMLICNFGSCSKNQQSCCWRFSF